MRISGSVVCSRIVTIPSICLPEGREIIKNNPDGKRSIRKRESGEKNKPFTVIT